jgi:IrrE N-terminal-like domain
MTAAGNAIQSLRKVSTVLRAWLVLCLLLIAASAAAAPPPSVKHSGPALAKSKEKSEAKLSKQEVEELFQSLKSILDFVSDDTKYPIKHAVKHQITSRDKVGEWINERLRDEQTAERLENGELVSKKLGLLPRDFDLRSFYLDLMREQVAGFYNPRNKTMYLLDWMPLAQQRPVMAHELTHALQDQSFQLDDWLKGDKKDDDKDKKKPADLDVGLDAIERDEQELARTALVEGQAMAVLLDYWLAPSQRTVINSPALVETLKESMLEGVGSPVFQGAPLYMKEILAFPYKAGLTFVQELLLEGGKDRAYAAAMRDPPSSSREVMVPKSYLRGEKVAPLTFPKLNPILGDRYTRYDVGAFGQFDVDVFLKEFGGEKMAEKLSKEWRGGAYYALRKKSDKNGERQKLTTGDIALLYLSRWSTPEAAKNFAAVYAGTLLRRYKFAQSQSAPAASVSAAQPVTHWTTDEGPVLVEQQGTTVLVLESFEAEFMSKLREAVFASQAEAVPAMAGAAP